MSTLADVFRELNTLKTDDVVGDHAIGGATAVLFYAEPARTYDIDVFVVLPQTAPGSLVSLEPFYGWARERRFPVDGEHILVHGVPVQSFRPTTRWRRLRSRRRGRWTTMVFRYG